MCNNHRSSKNSMPGNTTMNNAPTRNMTSLNLTAAADRPQPLFDAVSLARYVRRRREQIQLSVPEAASLAGMDAIDWYAVEGGWIPPEYDYRLHAIADALECLPGADRLRRRTHPRLGRAGSRLIRPLDRR